MCGDHHDHRNLNGFKPVDFPMISSRNFSVNLRILVVDDDADNLAFMSGLLKLLKHQVLSFRNPIEALSSLALEGNKFDLVMADLYLPTDRDGLQLVTRARDEFNLPIIMVSADTRESTILAALQHGVFHYIVKPVCFSDVKNLWQLVMRADAARRNALVRQIRGTKRVEKYSKRKRSSNVDANNVSSTKKQKVTWTAQLQARFLEAVNRIGLDQAVPKRILEVMNVEGLTRENVASHLQKYRMFLRKVVAKISTSKSSVHRPRNARGAMLFQQIGSDRRFGGNGNDPEASSSVGYRSNSFQHAANFSGFQSASAEIDWAKNTGPSPMKMHPANLGNSCNKSAGIGNPTDASRNENVGTLNWNSDFNSATQRHEEQHGGTLVTAPNSDITTVTALDCGSTSTDICSYPKCFDEDDFDFSDLFSDEFPLEPLDKDQDLDKFMESLLN